MRTPFCLYVYFFALIIILPACGSDDEVSSPVDPVVDGTPEGYALIWADEFNGSSINFDNWNHELGDGTAYGLPAGWGNNEMQIYTDLDDNSGIDKTNDVSALRISASELTAGNYTSAKLTSQSKFSLRFGRVDVKAKMPFGQGIWPAIWMLGDNITDITWPGCGEIDIVEILGQNPNQMYSTVHFTNSDNGLESIQGDYTLPSGDFSDDYHVYSLEWTPETIHLLVDGISVNELSVEGDMKEFLRSFYIILNVAVGGYWPGEPDGSTVFPQQMLVDYVRVYEQIDFLAPDAPVLDIAEETIGQILEANIADHAIQDGFDILGNLEVLVWGGGGEPNVGISDSAIEGDSSLVFNFQGGNWGGGYIKMQDPVDMSTYTNVHFSLKLPVDLNDAEIKLEGTSTDATVYLANYTGEDVGTGFFAYTIPLGDFVGLDVSDINIPFAMWNPQNTAQEFIGGEVLIDNLYFD
jgi:beta-glucanase (GH16 family)